MNPTSTGSSPVVALHGFTQIGRSWEPIIARLQQRLPGIAVAAPDLPGHGAGGDPCDLATAATALARRFGRSIWIGYSMGGRHLLRLAVDHPEVVEAMVLISTTAGIDDPEGRVERRRSDDDLASHLADIGIDAFLEEWLAQPMFAGRLPAEERSSRSTSASGLAGSLRLAGTGTMEPLWEALATSTIPTLVIAGADDAKFSDLARRLASTLSDSRLEIVEHAGHATHIERPDRVATLIADWLDAGQAPMTRPTDTARP
jgi:2-succinyl-6-hydroxy-2,4-cyclohexadiene-1-carboxylate synthase